MKISFDFDGTLSEKPIQKIAKKLIFEKNEVWIVTSRIKFTDDPVHKKRHGEVYSVANYLNIPHERIIFTNAEFKYKFLEELNIKVHLDDDSEEIKRINKNKKVKGIICLGKDWKTKFELAIEKLCT